VDDFSFVGETPTSKITIASLQSTSPAPNQPDWTRIELTDHSEWLVELLKRVGLDFEKGRIVIRIFAYSPKSFDLFDAQ